MDSLGSSLRSSGGECRHHGLPESQTHAFGDPETFARILERGGMDFTFLSKEYCCGNYLYRPAIKAKDEEAMTECRSYSKEFTGLNIEQMKRLGGRRLILFCSPCYPIYKYAFPEEDIIFYPQALSEVVGDLQWPHEIDYYAGCYKLHRNFADVPMDLKSTNAVFQQDRGAFHQPDQCARLLLQAGRPGPYDRSGQNGLYGPHLHGMLLPGDLQHAEGQAGQDPHAAGVHRYDPGRRSFRSESPIINEEVPSEDQRGGGSGQIQGDENND